MITPYSTAAEMLLALRQKKISAQELLDLHLLRIEQHNPSLNAIIFQDEAPASAAAQQADMAYQKGETRTLLGLPFTVKDWIEVKDQISTAGDAGLASSR
jgi:amidase